MTCEGCPYNGAKKIKYRLVENTDIMIIQEAPTREELLNGKLLCGRSGQLLKQLITKYQLNNYNISFVYSCKCEINKQDKKEANAAVKICKPNVLEAINKVKPKIIVTFGELASKQLLGSKISGGILANRGRIIHNDELDVDIFIAVHPEYVLRGCSNNYPNKPYELMSPKERMIFDDISLLQKVCENDFKSLGINTENYKEATLKDLEDISKSKVVAVDIETTGVGIGNNIKILSISFSCKPEHSRVVLLKDGDIQDINIKSKVNEILTNENISKVVAGRPFDENMWKKKLGVEWKGNIHDVLVMAHLVNENLPNGYNLESVAETFAHMRNIKDVAKGKRKCLTEEDKDILIRYNGVDSDATIRVYLKLKEELSKDKLLLRYYMKFLKPVLDMYADIGFYGFPLNINDIKDSENNLSVLAEELHNSLIDELPTLIKVMHEKKGLKLSRSDLILDYMFGNKKFTLGLKPKKFTNKTMKPATDEKHLKEFSNIKWVSGLLRWKKANKLLTTYYPQLYSAINDDGCIYPTTLFINTVTGRTVVLNPTIQTIPQRGEFAGYIKKIFKAPDGWKLCTRDLAQSELRIIGWMAKDKNILDALNKGIDLHTKTAAIVNNIDVSKVTKDMRQKAKPVNFGFVYGMQAKSFVTYAKDYYGVDFTLEEAENVRKNFFAYPTGYYKLPEYHSRMIGLARRYGYIRTPLGRVRRLPAIHSNEYMLRGDAERQAINTPVQSFSSDLALIGKLLFYYKLKELGWLNTKVKLLWFIHDAVMFMAKEEVAMDAHKMLKEIYLYDVPKFIKNTFKVDVTYPVESDGKIGDNWSEMTEVE
jgi:DNA polymerase-1